MIPYDPPLLLLPFNCACRYEPKDLDVRLQTPTGRSLFHVIRHRSLPKDATWVSLFDRDRDLGHDHDGIQVPPLLQHGVDLERQGLVLRSRGCWAYLMIHKKVGVHFFLMCPCV